MVSDGSLQLIPGAVPQLVHLAQDEAVLFFCVGLALVCTILQLQLLCTDTTLNMPFKLADMQGKLLWLSSMYAPDISQCKSQSLMQVAVAMGTSSFP